STIAPVITGGNTCVVLASEKNPLPAISFGEVLHASDVPGGVVNILSGLQEELTGHFTSHMDVNAILNASGNENIRKQIDENAALNVKRVKHFTPDKWFGEDSESPYLIMDFQEIKTTWHPIGF
ncbi:MAG: aldehyde dehydrogenase family protein, partial [Balneolaceae bacterium]